MKASRFSEEQIIGVLREHEAGAKTDVKCHPKIPPLYHLKFPPSGCSGLFGGARGGQFPLATPREGRSPFMKPPALRV